MLCLLSNANVFNEYDAFTFATIAIRVLLIIAAVAVLSYAMKSRLMFLAGLCGSVLGYLIPYKTGNRVSGSIDGRVYSHTEWKMSHVLDYGLLGVVVACGIVAAMKFRQRPKVQFSIGSLLLMMSAVAIIFWACHAKIWWPKD